MLEELDRKILYSLDEDSSKSLTRIGQETGTTPQLVKYRLERMEKRGLILAYWPMIEFRKLGYFNISYFLKLKNLSAESEKALYRYLNNRNDFNIVMRGDGYWDLHFTVSSRSLFLSVEAFNEFFDRFHQQVMGYDTAVSVGFFQFRREYLNGGKRAKEKRRPLAYTGADVEKENLGETDLRIIEELNGNSRRSYAEMAERLGMTRDAIIGGSKRIERKGIIQSRTLLLDHDRIGFPRFRILFRMSDLTNERFGRFFEFCQDHPNVIHLLRLLGNWQALIDVEIEDRERLRELLRRINSRFGDLILQSEITHAYRIDKFRDVPMKLAKA